MRTNIDTDDALLVEAMKFSERKTKKGTVDEALRLLVTIKRDQHRILALRGKIHWEGDLDEMRHAD